MLATILTQLTLAFNVPSTPAHAAFAATALSRASRGGTPVAVDLETKKAQVTQVASPDVAIAWSATESGYKYIDEVVGSGDAPQDEDVVQVHYTVTLLSSGTTLGSSRGNQPLTFALGKHDVPIWDEALKGMRVGGQRRMLVPPSAIPDTQIDKVPGEDRVLRFDFELVGTLDKNRPMAMIASRIPPGLRRAEIGRNIYGTLFALSFIPYFLPYDMQPAWYHDGKPMEEIRAERLQQANNRYIGGDLSALNELFPEDI